MAEIDYLLNKYFLTKDNSALAQLITSLYIQGYSTFGEIEKYLLSNGLELSPLYIKDLTRYAGNNLEILPIVVDLLAKRGYSLRRIHYVFKRYSISKEMIWDCYKNYPLGTTSELIYKITKELRSRQWTTAESETFLGILLDNHSIYEMGSGGRTRTYLQPYLRYIWEDCNLPGITGTPPPLCLEDWGDRGFVVNFANIQYTGRVSGRTPTIRYRINLANATKVLDRLWHAAIEAQKDNLDFSGGHLSEEIID